MFSDKMLSHIMMHGHTPHPDRSTYTHAQFWQEVKELPKDRELTVGGKPVPVPRLGRNLLVGDVLPERLAVAVNSRGEILRPNDFRDRYITYLRGFGSDRAPELEPIPHPLDWVMKQLDPAKPPSNGKAHYVELGLDTSRPAEARQTGEWHPDGVKMDEWKRKNPDLALLLTGSTASTRDAKVAMLLDMQKRGLLGEAELTRELSKLYQAPGVAVEHTEGSSDVEVDSVEDELGSVTGKTDVMLTMPCGREVRSRYANVHRAKCKHPECLETE